MARPSIYPHGRKLIPTICMQCKQEYLARHDLLEKGLRKFCGRPCYNESIKLDPMIRFWKKVDKTTSCWNWVGFINKKGYGSIWYNGENMRVHRFSYFIHFGEIPKDLNVCHSCDNPKCVNPKHLFIGTTQDNVDDKIKKGRGANGIKSVGNAKLSVQDVINIREMCKTSAQYKVAQNFNITGSTISEIVNRKTWGYIP